MDESVKALEDAVVGRSIVNFEKVRDDYGCGVYMATLDNGKRVRIADTWECCAGTDIVGFLFDASKKNNIITKVKVEEDYTRWYVMAEMDVVLDLNVSWTEGSGYYTYGFEIKVME